jgi:urea transport system ATP-binding protein
MTSVAAIALTELSQTDRILSLLVYLEQVRVVFDGFKALDIELFGIYHNELRVIIGPNGAGKTTLCDVVSGKTRVSTGKVYLSGVDVTSASETEIARRGVGRKFQTPTIFDSLTVYENVELALPRRRRLLQNLWGKTSAEEQEQIRTILKRVRLIDDANKPAKYLSHGQRQCLEISMLILAGPDLLLVDEPAAGLTDEETALMADLLLELRGQHAIIVIEHDMGFVRRLGSTITVLNEGQILAEGSMDEVQANPKVIEAYLGR